MTAAASTPGGINPNPRTNFEQVQNWQRMAQFLAQGSSGGSAISSSGEITPQIDISLVPPSGLNVSGSPADATGTLTLAWDNQSPNLFFAGPISGSAAAPTFRIITAIDLGLSAQGDLLTVGSAGQLQRLPIGSNGDVLSASGGTLTWTTAGSGGGSGIGTVGLALGSAPWLTVSGSPLTSAGTITITAATESANTVLAGPASGSAAVPAFRRIVPSDLNCTANEMLPFVTTAGAWGGLAIGAAGAILTSQLGVGPTTLTLSWQTELFDNSFVPSVDWNNRELIDSVGSLSLDWDNYKLLAFDGNLAYDYGVRQLVGSDGVTVIIDHGTASKGDIFTFGAAAARLPIGTNGQILAADLTQTTGQRWLCPIDVGVPQTLTFTDTTGTMLPRIVFTATASRVDGTNVASMAVDGASSTRWDTGGSINTTTDFFQIDMGSTLTVGGCVCDITEFPAQFPAGGQIQTSLNGSTWTTQGTWTGTAGGTSANVVSTTQALSVVASSKFSIAFAPVQARYVKLVPTIASVGTASNFWYIAEMEVFAAGAPGATAVWPSNETIAVTANMVLEARAIINRFSRVENHGVAIGIDANNWYGVVVRDSPGGTAGMGMYQCIAGVVSQIGVLAVASFGPTTPTRCGITVVAAPSAGDNNLIEVSCANAIGSATVDGYRFGAASHSLTLTGQTCRFFAIADSPNTRLRGITGVAGFTLP